MPLPSFTAFAIPSFTIVRKLPSTSARFPEVKLIFLPEIPLKVLSRYISFTSLILFQKESTISCVFNASPSMRQIRCSSSTRHPSSSITRISPGYFCSAPTVYSNIRQSSYVSAMEEPNMPGMPFRASYQPGFPPSISTPIP